MNYKIYYFLFAVISSVFIYLIPIYYVNSGFNEAQIGILTALFSIAAIIQPLFGAIAEGKKGVKNTLYWCLILVAISLFLLYFTNNFLVVFILVLIYATFITPATGFSDNLIAEHTTKNNKNYGSFKIYCTLGWGIGLLLFTPLISIFGLDSFLIFSGILTILIIFLAKTFDIKKNKTINKNVLMKNAKSLFLNKRYIFIMLFSSLFYGSYVLRGYYQSLLMSSVTEQEIFIALMAIAMMVPEILILPHYSKIANKYSFKKRMYFSVFIASIMMIIYTFSSSPYAILLGASLHGLIGGIYLPSILFETRKVVDSNITITAILFLNTSFSVLSSILAIFVITPIFISFGINYIFMAILVIILLSLIPLYFIENN